MLCKLACVMWWLTVNRVEILVVSEKEQVRLLGTSDNTARTTDSEAAASDAPMCGKLTGKSHVDVELPSSQTQGANSPAAVI